MENSVFDSIREDCSWNPFVEEKFSYYTLSLGTKLLRTHFIKIKQECFDVLWYHFCFWQRWKHLGRIVSWNLLRLLGFLFAIFLIECKAFLAWTRFLFKIYLLSRSTKHKFVPNYSKKWANSIQNFRLSIITARLSGSVRLFRIASFKLKIDIWLSKANLGIFLFFVCENGISNKFKSFNSGQPLLSIFKNFMRKAFKIKITRKDIFVEKENVLLRLRAIIC